jgi:uncharacterized phosphatase
VSSATTFALVRHGQTEWNALMRIQGRSDIPLNDTGRGQAIAAVDTLSSSDWDFVVSSPLSRAAETADLIAEGLGLTVTQRLPTLVERDYGLAEGLGAGARLEALREPGGVTGNGGFRGAEAEDDVADRGVDALRILARDFPGARIIVVSHGTLIRLCLMRIQGRPIPMIMNAALTVAQCGPDGWTLDVLNGERVDPVFARPV